MMSYALRDAVPFAVSGRGIIISSGTATPMCMATLSGHCYANRAAAATQGGTRRENRPGRHTL
jgi:hypothetical protein